MNDYLVNYTTGLPEQASIHSLIKRALTHWPAMRVKTGKKVELVEGLMCESITVTLQRDGRDSRGVSASALAWSPTKRQQLQNSALERCLTMLLDDIEHPEKAERRERIVTEHENRIKALKARQEQYLKEYESVQEDN